jgi:Rieske Fe-S protein
MLSSIQLAKLSEVGKAYPLAPKPAVKFAGGFVVKVAYEIDKALPYSGNWIVAFGSTCPHMGCLVSRVSYSASPQKLISSPCPCHGSTFDLTRDGLVVLGPATQNLPRLELEIVGSSLQAKGWLRKSEVDPTNEKWPCKPETPSPSGAV